MHMRLLRTVILAQVGQLIAVHFGDSPCYTSVSLKPGDRLGPQVRLIKQAVLLSQRICASALAAKAYEELIAGFPNVDDT